jgi:hypothetical protein
MENPFNPKTPENIGYGVEEKITPISPNKILYAAGSSFLVGAALKIAGKRKAGSFISKWALPLLALGCYRKFAPNSPL